jgi:hypothetical protein
VKIQVKSLTWRPSPRLRADIKMNTSSYHDATLRGSAHDALAAFEANKRKPIGSQVPLTQSIVVSLILNEAAADSVNAAVATSTGSARCATFHKGMRIPAVLLPGANGTTSAKLISLMAGTEGRELIGRLLKAATTDCLVENIDLDCAFIPDPTLGEITEANAERMTSDTGIATTRKLSTCATQLITLLDEARPATALLNLARKLNSPEVVNPQELTR